VINAPFGGLQAVSRVRSETGTSGQGTLTAHWDSLSDEP